jgi:hypothetical protein
MPETLQQRHSDVQKVFIGWCKALQDLERNPNEAVAIMAKAFKLQPAEFNDTRSGLRYINYEENKKLFGTAANPGPIIGTFDLAGQILKENNLTKVLTPGKDKIDLSITATSL